MPPPRIRMAPLFSRLHNLRASFRTPQFPHRQSGRWTAKGIIIRWGVVVMGAHWFTEYFYSITVTNGPSMLPTIPHSSGPWFTHPVVLFSAHYKRGRDVQVGDIVTYKHPLLPGAIGVKRIIGMPGDMVCVQTPGKYGDESLDKGHQVGEFKEEMIRVPEGHCWLAGDNLTWSRDSRILGPVPLNMIKSKALAVVLPPAEAKWLHGKGRGLTDVTDKEPEWVALS